MLFQKRLGTAAMPIKGGTQEAKFQRLLSLELQATQKRLERPEGEEGRRKWHGHAGRRGVERGSLNTSTNQSVETALNVSHDSRQSKGTGNDAPPMPMIRGPGRPALPSSFGLQFSLVGSRWPLGFLSTQLSSIAPKAPTTPSSAPTNVKLRCRRGRRQKCFQTGLVKKHISGAPPY